MHLNIQNDLMNTEYLCFLQDLSEKKSMLLTGLHWIEQSTNDKECFEQLPSTRSG